MSDEDSFFRPEAHASARRRIGSPVQPVGIGSWLLSGFMVAVLIAVIAFFTLARFARIESAAGTLEPASGAARIVAPRTAVVTRVHVSEGRQVKAGDALFTLGSDPIVEGEGSLGGLLKEAANAQGAALEQQTRAMIIAQQRQADEFRARRAGMMQRIVRLESDLEIARERLTLNEATLRSFEDLRQQRFLSEVRYRSQQAAVLDDRRNISSISGEIEATRAALAETAATLSRMEAESSQALASLESSRAALMERRATTSSQAAVIVPAIKSGRVTLQAREGSAVTAGSALAVVLPPGAKLRAQLWAPSRAAGFIRRGDQVRLLYDAFPYQRFGAGEGRVVAIASAPTDTRDIPISVQSQEALYRIDVELNSQSVQAYGREWPLSAGSRLTGDVVLESRSLLSWLLDPIRAIRERRM